jgi:DNA polymerase-1
MVVTDPAGKMILVDAHSLIFQVFHAIAAMTSPAGLPTNALFGFTRDILFLLEEKKPDYLLCAFDRPEKTFRDAIYPDYKAHRAPIPPDLVTQVPLIEQMLEALRVPAVSRAGFEADDVIATLAAAGADRGLDVLICSSDKDCRQLIDDRVRIYSLRKRDVLDREGLLMDWGVRPEQVVDLQTLVGDPVDNVPGVRGVGVKTAAKLLAEFGSLDNLLANLDRVASAKTREAVRAAAGQLALSRRLVRLDTAVPLDMDWEGWRRQEPDHARLLELFQGWGFRRLADQMRAAVRTHGAGPKATRPDRSKQQELFAEPDAFPFGANRAPEARPPAAAWQAAYHLVNTPQKLRDLLCELQGQKRIAVDLETTGLDPRRAEVVGFALSWRPGEAWYLPVRAPEGEAHLDPDETREALRTVLTDPAVAKVNQNVKYDLIVLRQHGVTVRGVAGDPMVADYLLHAGERSHNLQDLSNRYLDHPVIPITDLIGKGKSQKQMDEVPAAHVAVYAGEDADVAWRLAGLLETRLAEQGLAKLYRELEIPLIEVLAELEYNGIRLDVPLLSRLGADMERQLKGIEEEIYALAGHPFNIASPKQLRQVLFEELKLPTQRRTGVTGDASTDQETLERLAALGHALPRKIVEHRQVAKLKGTYVDALPGLVNPATGRVHASFNQTVAATGRLSSSDPNLQNIPVRREQGRQIRQAFVPEPGWVLLTADYSQVELRLLAHFTGEEELRRAFAEGRDVHAAVAAQVFGVAERDVNSEMRRTAKTINFGVIYGISRHGLAPRLGISPDEAAKYIDAFFRRYPKVAAYQANLLEKCRRDRYVTTILGRRREISGIRPDSTYQQRNQPEREAINMEIQGSAADLIKAAMLNIHRRLRAEKRRARMLLQIHDELVFETPPEELAAVARMVEEEMCGALPLGVPLKVDLAAGPNWLDVEEVET